MGFMFEYNMFFTINNPSMIQVDIDLDGGSTGTS